MTGEDRRGKYLSQILNTLALRSKQSPSQPAPVGKDVLRPPMLKQHPILFP